jgi:hypothetical protein
VGSASAARLPNAKEAKALAGAFQRDDSHPSDAVVANMRISTADRHWSEVRWFVPHNRKQKVKIITLHTSTYSGGPKHPKPATSHPPKKVKRDLKHHLVVVLTSTGSGQEDASLSGSAPSCAETESGDNIPFTFQASLHSTFSWTATWKINADQVLDYLQDDDGNAIAVIYVEKATDPTIGSGTDSYAYSNNDDFPECGDTAFEVSCNPTYTVLKEPALAVFTSTGVNIVSPFEEPTGTCSDGAPVLSHYDARWSSAPDPTLPPDAAVDHRGFFDENAIAPLSIVSSFGIETGPASLSFPGSVSRPDDPNVESTSAGLCENPETYDTCTDTLNWSGEAKLDVLP